MKRQLKHRLQQNHTDMAENILVSVVFTKFQIDLRTDDAPSTSCWRGAFKVLTGGSEGGREAISFYNQILIATWNDLDVNAARKHAINKKEWKTN